MQLLVTGFLISLLLWAMLCFVSLQGARQLQRGQALGEKWLLLVPYLFASLLFYGIRYRFCAWVLDGETIHRLFGIGAYWEADRIVFVFCIPLFYVVSVLRPQWVVRAQANLPLLVLIPFAIKLALYAGGLVGWDPIAAKMMPTRVE